MQSAAPTTLLLALTLATTAATAQQKVVPAGMDFVEAPLVYTYPFGRADASIQLLYDADQITLGQGVIWGMRFRQSQITASQTHPGYTKNYKVTAYTVAAAAATMSPDPAVNIGTATGTVVFQGALTLPPVTVITTYPAPFSIQIPFPVPYAYDGALGNLLLLVETDDLTAVPAGSYRIDAVNFSSSQITGLVSNLDAQGCVVNGGSLGLATSAAAAVVGGSLVQTLTPSTPGSFPVAMAAVSLGVQPTDMVGFGMPGCTLWLAPFTLQLTIEGSGGYPPVVWQLPNAPWIEGIAMAGQAFGLATSGALPDSVVSNGVATRIGSSTTPVMRMGMSFRSTAGWSMGQNGTFIAIVALDGVFP